MKTIWNLPRLLFSLLRQRLATDAKQSTSRHLETRYR